MPIGKTRWMSGTALAGIWLGLAMPAGAQPERPHINVVVYNFANVPPAVLDGAQRVVSRIFAAIDVDVAWSDVEGFGRAMPGDSAGRRAFIGSVIQVRLVSPAMHTKLRLKRTVLGAANPDARLALISPETIEHSARAEGIDVIDALGYVIAHEIGHVLLPDKPHAVTGLMRKEIDVQLVAHNRLSFLADEATLIRAALARGARPPAAR